jgi:hypothetical protein
LKAPEVNAMPATMEPKAGRMFSAVNEKRLRAAAFHFKAIEHHDDAAGDVADLARRACVPLDDMLEQLDAGAGTNSGAKRVGQYRRKAPMPSRRLSKAVRRSPATRAPRRPYARWRLKLSGICGACWPQTRPTRATMAIKTSTAT